MQRLEVSGAVRHIYASLGFKGLRKVPVVALWRMVCKCFVKSSLESNRRPRYFTVLDQGMVKLWS